jgi:ABC-type transport system substrate-binding protein
MEHSNGRNAQGITRRRVLGYGLGGAVASGLLAACSSRSSEIAVQPVGPPQRGGPLRVAMISEGAVETLDPWAALGTIGYLRRVTNLYDTLVEFEDDLEVQPAFAETYDVSADFPDLDISLAAGRHLPRRLCSHGR